VPQVLSAELSEIDLSVHFFVSYLNLSIIWDMQRNIFFYIKIFGMLQKKYVLTLQNLESMSPLFKNIFLLKNDFDCNYFRFSNKISIFDVATKSRFLIFDQKFDFLFSTKNSIFYFRTKFRFLIFEQNFDCSFRTNFDF